MPTCDAYLLMEVIHDWSDDESISILQAIRKAAAPHASGQIDAFITMVRNLSHQQRLAGLPLADGNGILESG